MAHVAALLVLDHVAVGAELAEGLAFLDVLEQLVDLLGKVAIHDVGALVGVLSVEDRGLDVAVALVARDLQAGAARVSSGQREGAESRFERHAKSLGALFVPSRTPRRGPRACSTAAPPV